VTWEREVVHALVGPRELDDTAVQLLLATLADAETLARLQKMAPEEAARALAAPLIPAPPEVPVPMPEHALEPTFIVALFNVAR
jgi:hypothetical protein